MSFWKKGGIGNGRSMRFAEITDQSVSETYLPLVAFGKSITDVSGENLTALAIGDGAGDYGDKLQAEGVDEIILAEVPGASPVQTDILGRSSSFCNS